MKDFNTKELSSMEQAQMAEIYDRLHDSVYRTALTYCRNVPDAEDIMHDVFLARFGREGTFPDAETEKAWMLRVTINRCKDLLKSSRRTRHVPLEEAETVCIENEAEREVYEAVNALPVRYRMVVHLYYFEGYTVKEIGELTGTSESAVQTQLYRARKLLRTALGEEFTP